MWGWALVGASLGGGTVELPVVASFVEGEYGDGVATGWVDRGWKDGVLGDSRGVRVFRRLEDGTVILVGTADVLERKRYETKVELHLAEGVEPQLGDTARLPAQWKTVAVPIAWDLAREDIRILDAEDRNLVPWEVLRKDAFAVSDEALCGAVAERVRAVSWEGWEADTVYDTGRNAGRTLRQVAAAATPADACAAMFHLVEGSEAAHGSWSAEGAFAVWVMYGAELSFLELERVGPTLDDAAFAAMVLAHRDENGWGNALHGKIFEALERGERERAEALLSLLERWDRMDDDPWSSFWAQMARGEMAFADGDGVAAAEAWTVAMALEPVPSPWAQGKVARARRLAGDIEGADEAWRAALASGDIGVRNWEEYADLMVYLERWTEAETGYRACIAGWTGQTRDEQATRMSWCQMGLGRALQEQGRYDESWDAWLVAYEIATARGWNLWQAKAEEAFGELGWQLSLYARSGADYDDAVALRRRGNPLTEEVADALDRAALSYWEAGQRDVAMMRINEAIDLQRQLGLESDLAWSIRKLGIFEDELGDQAAAIALYREALAHFPEDAYTGRARVMQDIAGARFRQGRAAEGDAALAEAAALAEKSGDTLEMALVADTRSSVHRTIEAQLMAVEAWRRHGDPRLLANTLDALVRLEMDAAPPEVVDAHLAEARALAEKGDYSALRGRVQVTAGWWAFTRGDPDTAQRLAEEGLETAGTFATPHQILDGQLLLAQLDAERNDPEAGVERLDAVLGGLLAQPNLRRLRPDVILLRAQLLGLLGRYEEAMAVAEEGRRLAEELGLVLSEETALLTQASLQAMQGQVGAAWRSTQRAAAIQEAELPMPGGADLILAGGAVMAGKPDVALAASERALALLPAQSVRLRSDAFERRALARRAFSDFAGAKADLEAAAAMPGIGLPQRADIAPDLAEMQVFLGDPASALKTLEIVPPPDEDPLNGTLALAVRANALTALGRTREAVATAQQAVAHATALRAPSVQAYALDALGEAKRAHGDIGGAIADYRDAIVLYDDVHASIGDPEGVLTVRAGPEGLVFEHLALALDATGRQEEAADARRARGEQPVREVRVASSFDEYARSLAIEVSDLADRIAVPTSRFASFQQDLAEDEALLVPVVLPDRVVVFVARSTGAPTWTEVAVPEAQVAALVAEMREALQAPDTAWQPTRGVKMVRVETARDPTAAARELERLVVGPVREQLAGVATLVVAPGGRLRYVPFAALTDGERFLVQDFRLALLTASGTSTTHRRIDPKDGVFALSNPDGTLPGATAEVLALGRTWGRHATVRDGAEATEEALRAGVAGAGIVHLATHGFLDNERPRDSYLLMAGEEARLTLAEISLLPLQDVDLVVLSACETAVGDRGEGKEIAGLAYPFEVRGAASVIASLWAVDDASTSELMVDLYGGLRKRHTRAEALRDAQLALLADPETAHPYHWAPFILIGDWR